MKYTVVWPDAVQDELADIWIHASDRRAVTMAANQMERELRTDAPLRGRLLRGSRRMLRLPPLLVVFDVSPDDCLVTVLKVLHTS